VTTATTFTVFITGSENKNKIKILANDMTWSVKTYGPGYN